MWRWMSPALVATLLYGVWGFLPKLSSRYLKPESAVVYEVLGALFFGIVALIWLKGRVEVNGRGVLFAGLTDFSMLAGGLFYLYACQRGPLGSVVTLTALYPLVTIILARVFLEERMTLHQWIGVGLALSSVWFLSHSRTS